MPGFAPATFDECARRIAAAGHAPLSEGYRATVNEQLQTRDLISCQATGCGTKWPAHLIDAKAGKGSSDYNVLECPECYGPNWSPP